MDRHAHRAVVGAGTWGTTLALHLAKQGPVVLLTRDEEHAAEIAEERQNRRYVPGINLPVEVEITADPQAVASADELVIFAVPASAMRDVAGQVGPHVHPDAILLSVAKGIEHGTLLRMTQVLAQAIPAAMATMFFSAPHSSTPTMSRLR
jgi:glycerol-3-phosphate dehydrogenase (NAD(P)+)